MKAPVKTNELPLIPAPEILPSVLNEPAVTLLVAVIDLLTLREPAKELEPVEEETKLPLTLRAPKLEVPVVLKPPAVMLLVAVIDLETLRLPAKVDEPVPVPK